MPERVRPGQRLRVSGTNLVAASHHPIIFFQRNEEGGLYATRASEWTQSAVTLEVPPQLRSGWFTVRPSVNGTQGHGRVVFVDESLGQSCAVGCVSGQCVGGVCCESFCPNGTCATGACEPLDGGFAPDGGPLEDAGTTDGGGTREDGGFTDGGSPDRWALRVSCDASSSAAPLLLLALLLTLQTRRARCRP